ncbi:OadG family protein [Kangiella koreensis]|uniref:Probable oxaloacetate decarboxylase gamma chain n=1 Tax=Kangiella koreensis (strain DSM 16069 / JCM 12317 / KCTC 12182 / SW-125) TaxID=523791 RepID=C7RBM1_KANKD|nr:OadG family protein [Kangiella koreensis]ACV26663.1 sodium pump decarboxylase, gamma subunit [Kangiella koreensis DSM 16069]
MNELISGLSLMLVGMTTVFCFLTLLVICIHISSKVINRFWPEALPSTTGSTGPSTQRNTSTDDEIVAAITSAVHQYRNREYRKKDSRKKHQ